MQAQIGSQSGQRMQGAKDRGGIGGTEWGARPRVPPVAEEVKLGGGVERRGLCSSGETNGRVGMGPEVT